MLIQPFTHEKKTMRTPDRLTYDGETVRIILTNEAQI